MCRELLLNDSRPADADLFNFWWPDVTLPQLSLYRCQGSGSGSYQLSQEPVYSGGMDILRPARTSTLIDRGAQPPHETVRSGSGSLQQIDRNRPFRSCELYQVENLSACMWVQLCAGEWRAGHHRQAAIR